MPVSDPAVSSTHPSAWFFLLIRSSFQIRSESEREGYTDPAGLSGPVLFDALLHRSSGRSLQRRRVSRRPHGRGSNGRSIPAITGQRGTPGRRADIRAASRGGRTAEGATAGAYPRSRAREGLRAVVLISERRSPVTYAVFIPNQVRTDQEASDPGLSPPARSRQAWHRRGMGAVRSI